MLKRVLVAAIVVLAALYPLASRPGAWDSFTSIFGVSLLRSPSIASLTGGLTAFLLALAIAYCVELYVLGFQKSSLRKLLHFERQTRYDLVFTIIPQTGFYATIVYLMQFGSVSMPWIDQVGDLLPISGLSFFPLQLAAMELAQSFLQYWQHRLQHRVPALWETHKFHHSAEDMTILSLNRETPFTAWIAAWPIVIPAAIVGSFKMPSEMSAFELTVFLVYLVYGAFNQVNQFLIHSNLNLSYGWFGRYFIVSPANHRVHHSILTEHLGKNFSVTLVLWDRLFGTFHEGTDSVAQDCPIGYAGNIYGKSGPVVDYLRPTVGFFWMLFTRPAYALFGTPEDEKTDAKPTPATASA